MEKHRGLETEKLTIVEKGWWRNTKTEKKQTNRQTDRKTER